MKKIQKDVIKQKSAGIVIVREENDKLLYLLLRAYRNWDFPKGLIDGNELPLETAIREVKEETGIDDISFEWGEVFTETEPYNNKKKIARYYLSKTSNAEVVFGINPELGKAEHDEFRWLDYESAYELLFPRLQRVIEWAKDIITR